MSKSYILIDNDFLVRKTWEFQAKKAEVNLNTFQSVDDFLNHSKDIDLEVFIYIDSELDDEKLGEIEAKKIFDEGFKKLYLATGKQFDSNKLPEYFLGIASKYPPF